MALWIAVFMLQAVLNYLLWSVASHLYTLFGHLSSSLGIIYFIITYNHLLYHHLPSWIHFVTWIRWAILTLYNRLGAHRSRSQSQLSVTSWRDVRKGQCWVAACGTNAKILNFERKNLSLCWSRFMVFKFEPVFFANIYLPE